MGSFARKMGRKAQKSDDRRADDVVSSAISWAMNDTNLTRRVKAAGRRLGLPPMELVTLLVTPELHVMVRSTGQGVHFEEKIDRLNAWVTEPIPVDRLANAVWATDQLRAEVASEKKVGMRVNPAHSTLIAYVSSTESLAAFVGMARLNDTAEGYEDLGAVDHVGAGD